jgi:HAD superfamily hydrolase (TIGR01549 family)
LDLDDTLYSYKFSHKKSIDFVLSNVASRNSIDIFKINSAFEMARNKLKILLPTAAAGHSRILYFQIMYEILGITPFPSALFDSDDYWDCFLENIKLSDDACRFLDRYSDIPICLVTDLTAEIQYKKIIKLGISNVISHIVTSEEVGIEKPHPLMFIHALGKLNLNKENVVMIGDSFKKDAVGALNAGIKPFWLNKDGLSVKKLPAITEIKNLDEVDINE